MKKNILNKIIRRLEGGIFKSVHYKTPSVTINIEGRCNLKCEYCIYHGENSIEGYKNWWLSFEQIKPEIDILVKYGIKNIHVCGTGEPFLNRDIFKIFKYIRSNGAITSVLSNGTSVISDKLEKIIEADLRYFKTDIDSIDRNEYKQITGKDQLDIILNNVKQLVDLRNIKKSKMLIGVNTIIRKESLNKLDAILDKCIMLGVDFWNLTQLLISFEDKGVLTRENKFLDNPDPVRKIVGKLIEKGRKHNINVKCPAFFKSNSKNLNICLRPWSTFMLNVPNINIPKEKWYGNAVVGCTNYKTVHYPLGNLFDDGPHKIWNGKQIKLLRENLMKNKDRECVELCVKHRFHSTI